MEYSEESDPKSSVFRPSSEFRPPIAARTTEIPIIYLTTHGSFNVKTDGNGIEINPDDYLGLPTTFPEDMTILKFNFVPINVCNYGGTGVIGTKNIADKLHHLISIQLDPRNLMARYGFEYFLSRDEIANEIIGGSFFRKSLEKYRGEDFIDVDPKFYGLLYDVAHAHGLEEGTVLDSIMSELNDCLVNDNATSESKLTKSEKESIMRGQMVMNHKNMIMKIIDECVKKPAKDLKAELELELEKGEIKLEELRETSLFPELTKTRTAQIHTSQKPFVNTFKKDKEVSDLMGKIDSVKAYINHVDDGEAWSISIPNKSGITRRILNKEYSLGSTNVTNGFDWTISKFNPKPPTTLEDLFNTREIKPGNEETGTFRTLTTLELLMYLNRIGVKTVILVDQTCSVFSEILPDGRMRYPNPMSERRWAYEINKRLSENPYTIYGGKRKKHKTKKLKTQKTKNTKNQKTKKLKNKKPKK